MAILKVEIPPPWDEIDAKSRRGLSLLFGETVADTQARYEKQRRLIAEANEIAEERAAEAEATMERLWHVPTLEERAWALARARHREEHSKLRHLELGRTLDEHYRAAHSDIQYAEKVLEDTKAALAEEKTHD